MSVIKEPQISEVNKSLKPYVKIKFIPDYQRFGIDGLDDNHY